MLFPLARLNRATRISASFGTVLAAATVIIALLLCPALTRVLQVQPLGQTTTDAPSFQKSLDVPQDPHIVVPDMSCVRLVDVDVDRPRVADWLRPSDDVLSASPPDSRPLAFRAPPAAFV